LCLPAVAPENRGKESTAEQWLLGALKR
jgi:hypothetical protein